MTNKIYKSTRIENYTTRLFPNKSPDAIREFLESDYDYALFVNHVVTTQGLINSHYKERKKEYRFGTLVELEKELRRAENDVKREDLKYPDNYLMRDHIIKLKKAIKDRKKNGDVEWKETRGRKNNSC